MLLMLSIFGRGSWGLGILARRSLERHLEYLAPLTAEGNGIRLSVSELRIALDVGPRIAGVGFSPFDDFAQAQPSPSLVGGVAESALRSKLANYLDAPGDCQTVCEGYLTPT